jgi:hypothetical protein
MLDVNQTDSCKHADALLYFIRRHSGVFGDLVVTDVSKIRSVVSSRYEEESTISAR